MLNTIILMGRLTRDPELRYTQSQTPVASFSLAVEQDYVPQGQERKTDFINCVAWRGTAEFVSKYFTKGQLAAVRGRLQIRDYTDRDGNKRQVAEVVVDNVYFAEKKRDRAESDYETAERAGKFEPAGDGVDAGPGAFADLYDGDGEVPF
mgnify:CR=1 FL=1